MNPLYNFAISAYKTAVKIASVRNDKAKRMLDGHKEIFDILKRNISATDDYIWIHASSLGEFEQGRPIIEAIKNLNPKQKILLTFFSPSGYDVRKLRRHSLLVLSKKEYTDAAAFREAHNMSCRNRSTFQYELTHAGIGTIISIRCPVCGKTEDITDTSIW